jgi:hypothetical protein
MAEAQDAEIKQAGEDQAREKPPEGASPPEQQATEDQETQAPRKKQVHAHDRRLDPDEGYSVLNEEAVGSQFIGDNIRFGSYTAIGNYKEQNYTTNNTTATNLIQSETSTIYNVYNILVQSHNKQMQEARDAVDEEQKHREQAGEASGKQQLPADSKTLGEWFYGLTSFEQCFVQAMAVFDGSTVKEVMNAARRLYSRRIIAEQDTSSRQDFDLTGPRNIDDPEKMLERTYVKRHRLEKSMRCRWIDTDAQGNSLFKERVLSLLARDVHFWQNNTFYDQLFVWADNLIDENVNQALQALGTIAWHNKQDLEHTAQKWAKTSLDWFRASPFLLGAYLLDLEEYGEERAHHPQKSPVLSVLQKWSSHALSQKHTYAACAAALTYALLGTYNLQLAFDGLEGIFHQSPQSIAQYESGERTFPEKLWETIVMAYAFLADMGHLRSVLEYLAGQAKQLIHDRERLNLAGLHGNERTKQLHAQWLRQLRADIILDAFYYLAMQSLHHQKKTSWVKYDLTLPLPESPSLGNYAGREILLAGLLAPTETAWQSHICTLLCLLLLSNAKEAAFILLRQWAELVLKDQGPAPDRVRLCYLQFMLKVASIASDWGQHLRGRYFKVPDIYLVFQQKLGQWQKEGQRRNLPLSLFAQDVLNALFNSKIAHS